VSLEKKPLILKDDNQTVFFDVDETLVHWYPKDIDLAIDGHPMQIMRKTVQYLKECKLKGMNVIVWSQGGGEWAAEVVEALELNSYVDVCISKPHVYVDDLGQFLWMGKWIKVNENGDLSEGFEDV
jgi:predicted HAD superfamily phosphohydrolase YqeG